jgi:hypothetical protein
MLGGVGMVAGSVLATKALMENAVDPLVKGLMGYEAAHPMTREQVAGSDTTLGRQLPGYENLSQEQKLQFADYALANGILSDKMTKKNPDEAFEGSDGAKLGSGYGQAVLHMVRNNSLVNSKLAAAGLSNPFADAKSGPMKQAGQNIQQMGLEDQNKLYSTLFSGDLSGNPSLAGKLDALKKIGGLFGLGGGSTFNNAPPPESVGANPKFAGADAVAGLLALAQPRSKTSSPGIGIDGKPLKYW